MPRYHQLGELPPQPHLQFRRPDGGLYSEQLFSTRGFSGPMSTLYHERPATEILAWEDAGSAEPEYEPAAALRHRHWRTASMPAEGDPFTGRRLLMGNADLEWHQVHAAEPATGWVKNADGDEVLFVPENAGVLESPFGDVPIEPGDYVVVPRGVVVRLRFASAPVRLIALVSYGPVEVPRRYRNEIGQLLEHAPYSERDLRPPVRLVTETDQGPAEVLVRARNRYTRLTMPDSPRDVVGWDGYVFPYAFSIHRFSPITGTRHMPPPIHQTFAAAGFVVCSFCPRQLDYHPEAVPAPYVHSNVDSDEVLYYVNDKFGSRRGIEAGSITLHPLGIPHGPQPGATEASLGAARTEELAVMVDTYRPLRLAAGAAHYEDPEYWRSWQRAS
jgi:homogentisate 1,2-dioxygenase